MEKKLASLLLLNCLLLATSKNGDGIAEIISVGLKNQFSHSPNQSINVKVVKLPTIGHSPTLKRTCNNSATGSCPEIDENSTILNFNQNSTYYKITILKIPLSYANLVSFIVIILLTIIGSVYVWILGTRKFCRCSICTNEYILEKKIGVGGFSNVYMC